MTLLDEVAALCARLAPAGWGDLLARHGLDLAADDLAGELVRQLAGIDRRVPGFEDFAAEGRRAIEAGRPARSLLYHALASPNVVQDGGGNPLSAFPTLGDIEAVENYVFGFAAPSVEDLVARSQGAFLAIAVFACEYRPAPETVHRKHADLCFSRTGVARVGTAAARYDAARRGFVALADDERAVRVLPARYAAYVAVQRPGDEHDFGPMHFSLRQRHPEFFGPDEPGDDARLFWVPLHKLFSGPQCLRGLDLTVGLEARHRNEKLRRVHLELSRTGADSGWGPPDIDHPPFVFGDGIAEWSTDPEHGRGLMLPVVHPRLVEPASYQGEPLTLRVPPNPDNGFAPSLTIPSDEGFRRAPEYVHVRHAVGDDGALRDLNDVPGVAEQVRAGGYDALHYVDFSGDGWVGASVPQLAVDLPRTVPAYSVVTAPDFYPDCDQRELVEWWIQQVPSALRASIWQTPPLTLSDERLAPNLQLPGVDFRAEDDTVTAIVSLPLDGPVQARPLTVAATLRHAHLPDAAAGVFAPGWDTSLDRSDGTAHLAAYGLGSPFPEDAKLCAALSTFWPAVAPDAGRSFSVTFPTVSPLTDEEIGVVGDLPWDDVPGPRLVTRDDRQVVEYAHFDHVDYVQKALDRRFTLALTAQVDVGEYRARILAMARAYLAAGIGRADRRRWPVLSFRVADPADPRLAAAQAEAGAVLQGRIYAVDLGRRAEQLAHPSDHRKAHVVVAATAGVFVGALPVVLVNRDGGGWQAVDTV